MFADGLSEDSNILNPMADTLLRVTRVPQATIKAVLGNGVLHNSVYIWFTFDGKLGANQNPWFTCLAGHII